jgi:putative hemolysin
MLCLSSCSAPRAPLHLYPLLLSFVSSLPCYIDRPQPVSQCPEDGYRRLVRPCKHNHRHSGHVVVLCVPPGSRRSTQWQSVQIGLAKTPQAWQVPERDSTTELLGPWYLLSLTAIPTGPGRLPRQPIPSTRKTYDAHCV